MANEYFCFGFPVNADADLNRLYTDNRALLDRMETPEGAAEVLRRDDGPALWFYGLPGGPVQPALCEPGLNTGTGYRVRARKRCRSTESPCPVWELKFENEGSAFMLPMLLLNHPDHPICAGTVCRAKPALFPRTLRIYADREDFLANQPGHLDCPSVLPWKDPAHKEIREPLARMTGFAVDSALRINPLTGLPYAVLTLDCFGFRFPVATDPDQLDGVLPQSGSVLSGIFRICGTASREDGQ